MYFAFLTSFVTIGIMWLNHHRLFTLIQRCTHSLILLNTLLLLGVTVVPFPTAVLAQNLREPLNERTAALLYNGWFVFIAIVFNVLWRYASADNRLLGESVDRAAVRAQTKQYAFGPLFYLVAFAASFINVPLGIGISLALALFFALPPRSLSTPEARHSFFSHGDTGNSTEGTGCPALNSKPLATSPHFLFRQQQTNRRNTRARCADSAPHLRAVSPWTPCEERFCPIGLKA
jgi:uncharacterized membrane protein